MMLLASVLAGSTAWAEATPSGGNARQEGVIDPRADEALHHMSDYLGSLDSFRVDAMSVEEKIATDGEKIQELKQSKITVRRPGELRVDRIGPRGHSVFRDDGRRFSLYNAERNVYAVAPAPTQLDTAIDRARDCLHIDAPGGDLLVSAPYDQLVDGLEVGHYIGLEPVGSVMAHHLAIRKGDVDYQIWIQAGPQAVPLRYVITSKDMPGQPEFTIDLRNWQPNVQVSDRTFQFTPPPGAQRIDLRSELNAPRTATR